MLSISLNSMRFGKQVRTCMIVSEQSIIYKSG